VIFVFRQWALLRESLNKLRTPQLHPALMRATKFSAMSPITIAPLRADRLVSGAKLWSAPALLVLEQSSSTPKATFAPETRLTDSGEPCIPNTTLSPT